MEEQAVCRHSEGIMTSGAEQTIEVKQDTLR